MTTPAFEFAISQQKRASDPTESQIASANAGSGKTKVLVDRVCRILCMGAKTKDGPDPGKILCLTYTKAAASEMQSRLFAKLGQWSILPEADLNQELNELFGFERQRTAKELAEARELFARALETPEGLKIQTIHSFCERVLGRFPLEAGITPGFEALDERDSYALQKAVREDLLAQAQSHPESELAWAVRRLAQDMANVNFDDLLKTIAAKGDAIKVWQERGGLTDVAVLLDLPQDVQVKSVLTEAWQSGPLDDIRRAAQGLLNSDKKTDLAVAAKILTCFELPADLAFEAYREIYFTTKGDLRAGVVTKNADPLAVDVLGYKDNFPTPEADRVVAASERVLGANCLEITRAIYVIAGAYHARYSQAKRQARKLDFDDQITFVKNLLTQSEAAEWIRYKLDYGIEHILIDEAQDTSPEQWQIIDALRDGFVDPDPDQLSDDPVKTFFAVGDEKQSIYSFQGARPDMFRGRTRDHYAARDQDPIQMQMSFRSSQEILDVVDTVFEGVEGLQKLFGPLADGSPILHSAHKTRPGQVELWPLAPPPVIDLQEEPWDTRPVDVKLSSRESLAAELAVHIRKMLDRGEPINARDQDGQEITRPLQAGDILILVKKRKAFFNALIRHLKINGIPVAGADRLVLKDAVVVKDLLALTRFVLLPSDDLSLAETLRTPLIDLSEDELFEIAHDRGGISLWAALQKHEAPFARRAASLLETCLGHAGRFAPYEFYSRVLDEGDSQGGTVRGRLYRRLGLEAEDALDAFLSRALAHQRKGSPSLQLFLQDFMRSDQDIKREMERVDGEVRVMTVHGAKGLEAPLVILPDTTQLPRKTAGILSSFKDGFVYLPSAKKRNDALEALATKARELSLQEDMRLLYVAMTRAESRLIVCGFHSGNAKGKGLEEGCWYDQLRGAMDMLPTSPVDTPFDAGRQYGAINAVETETVTESKRDIELPDWINLKAAPEIQSVRNLTPSDLLQDSLGPDMPLRSPGAQSQDRFSRGNIIHKLLELLPDIDPSRRQAAAQAYLNKHRQLSETQKQQIITEIFNVLDHPEFAPFFAPGSTAELSLAGRASGLPEDVYLNAQIDRLAVTDTHVYVIDFKSNRPPPQHQDQVPEIYWGQMAAYRAMIRDIYPDREVRCALLWTDGPDLMILDEERLDQTLTKISALLT